MLLDAGLSLYTLHPLIGRGYQFWSGVGSDIGELTIVGTLIGISLTFWHHHNCHIPRCWRLSWHPHPDHGHPVCRHHFPNEAMPGVS